MKSVLDSVSDYLSPAIRKIGDYHQSIVGSSIRAIRIIKETKDAWAGNGQRDVFGDFSVKSEVETSIQVIGNIIIKNPYNKVELFGTNYQQASQTKALNPEEQLPVEFFLIFEGNYSVDPVAVKNGDLFVDYFKDEHNNVIPIYWEVSQIFGSLFGKNIVRKSGTLVPYRGNFEKSIEKKVTSYLKSVIASLA